MRSASASNHPSRCLQVQRFLNERHPKKYFIFNVSERTYDKSRFEDRVSNYNWPDHHAPPFHLLFELVDEMYKWLKCKSMTWKQLKVHLNWRPCSLS